MPVNGRYPKKAEGDAWNHLRRLAFEINTPRLIVRPGQLGMWRRLIMRRLPDRINGRVKAHLSRIPPPAR